MEGFMYDWKLFLTQTKQARKLCNFFLSVYFDTLHNDIIGLNCKNIYYILINLTQYPYTPNQFIYRLRNRLQCSALIFNVLINLVNIVN